MAQHEKFNFNSLDDLKNKVKSLNLDLPFSNDLSVLAKPVSFGRLRASNAVILHPMEGCDGESDGSPGELTYRRYQRFAAGGAGLIWVEACAVVPEGKANPRQISLNDKNVKAFEKLVTMMRQTARESMGSGHAPVLILQLTHSGRYSKPCGKPAPIIAHHSKVLDFQYNLTADHPLVTDEYLDRLQEQYVISARLAAAVGFDGVDIKSCHRYLVSELLASFTRTDSRYGGSFENRTRFLRETVARVIAAVPSLEVTCRLNAFDAIPYPYGFGVDHNDFNQPDLREPVALVGELAKLGVHGVNISVGNPYFNPHYGRPYDVKAVGVDGPGEHPLESLARFIRVVRGVQQAHPALTVIGGGFSWVRQFLPYLAAGVLEKKWAGMVGAGREAFAYPDFVKDVLATGSMDPRKCCIACSACTQIMRDSGRSGCVPRDAEIYAPIYREGRRRNEKAK